MHAVIEYYPQVINLMQLASDQSSSSQLGFTFIEMMIVIAIVGVLASVAVISYQTYIRKAQVTTIYQEINHFRMPYETLMNEGAGVRGFSPDRDTAGSWSCRASAGIQNAYLPVECQ